MQRINKRIVEIDTEIKILKESYSFYAEKIKECVFKNDANSLLYHHKKGEIKPQKEGDVIEALSKQRDILYKISNLYREKCKELEYDKYSF